MVDWTSVENCRYIGWSCEHGQTQAHDLLSRGSTAAANQVFEMLDDVASRRLDVQSVSDVVGMI